MPTLIVSPRRYAILTFSTKNSRATCWAKTDSTAYRCGPRDVGLFLLETFAVPCLPAGFRESVQSTVKESCTFTGQQGLKERSTVLDPRLCPTLSLKEQLLITRFYAYKATWCVPSHLS